MTISNKSEIVNTPSIQIDKNVITYGNSFIYVDNISLITISSVPLNMSWIGAIITAILSIIIIKLHFIGVITLIGAIIWLIVVVSQNYNRGKNLTINLNSGTTLYFNCADKLFLEKVVYKIIETIKNKEQSTYIINFQSCTIREAFSNSNFVEN